jgi:hypothetical protein
MQSVKPIVSSPRYKELKYQGQKITEAYKIDKILIDNKFNWLLDAEIKNARIEIYKNTLVWNAGTWMNGVWEYGVVRDIYWLYGTWKNGVWYNGHWMNGKFESGIIFNGKFINGEILGGEIRGGEFLKCNISNKVKKTESIIKTPQEEFKAEPMKLEKFNHIDNWIMFNEKRSIDFKGNLRNIAYFVTLEKDGREFSLRVENAKDRDDAKEKALNTAFFMFMIKFDEDDIVDIKEI